MLFARVIRRESYTQQAFAPDDRPEPRGNIQKWRSEQCAIFDDADTAWLFDDKQSAAAITR